MEGTPLLAEEKVLEIKSWLEALGFRVEIGR
jgi:replicative superfamily II helicase